MGLATLAASAPASAATHNDADVSFAQNMIPHHQRAIEMTDMIVATQSVDPEIVSRVGAPSEQPLSR